MECGSCGAVIPDDSIFCSECGARQEFSRAGSFSAMGSESLGGGEVTGGRGFGVVSGEAVRQQREMQQQGMPQGIPADILQNIASGIQQQNNLPPGSQLPQQQPGQFPNQMSNQFPQQQPFVPQGQPMPQGVPANTQQSDIPQQPRGPTLASGAVPTSNVESQLGKQLGGTTVTNNPTASPTDAMVNRLAEAERMVKNERRSQWLNMNQSSASNVLANLGADLPSHLKDAQGITPAAEVIAGTMGQPTSDGPNDALLRRMCEVASRRVARKRGVAVETPEAKIADGRLVVNLTYVDDGRVLDTPEDLSSAFEHAIQTEVALKGYDMAVEIVLSCMKDGQVTTVGAEAEEDDEEMFACEVCDGLVKESDPKCPHCGAIFEEEDEEIVENTRKGPPGPSRSGPPGPSKGGPPGPKKGGPPGPSKGGPPGPKKGGPPGPSKGGPPGPSKGGPPGPKKGGPPKGGPSGPKKGGPPGPKKGGPPGPKRGPPN
ncbi:MAG: hypothetical protein ACPH54_03225 [Candidatus Poseidoniaceae archaeon]